MSNEYLAKYLELGGPFGFGRFATHAVDIEREVKRETAAIMARWEYVYEYAWAIPTDETIALLAAHGPIVEVGAGGGYWAKLLRDKGVEVAAYDVAPGPIASPTEGARGKNVRRVWTEVLLGGATSARAHPDHTLFLCWPPYDTPMASIALTAYLDAGGQKLAYVGEGPGGCTADNDFHDLVEERMDEQDVLHVPQWPGIHDLFYFYVRKENT